MTKSKYQLSEYVNKFVSYVNEVEASLDTIASNDSSLTAADHIPAILNGEASKALNRIIPAKIRKKEGIFFTGQPLSMKVAQHLKPIIEQGCSIFDPACGAGNLLMACAKFLPIGKQLDETLQIWGERIHGNDLYDHFVNAAKLRLVLLAATIHKQRNVKLSIPNNSNVFPALCTGDSLSYPYPKGEPICVALNPPFGQMDAPKDCTWAKGRVQVAGVFIDSVIKKVPNNSHIVAILPDVLRSGSNYSKWRQMVASYSESLEIEMSGKFDRTTDVDVFIMHLKTTERGNNQSKWPKQQPNFGNCSAVLSDMFDIHVGPLVPYRNPNKGSWKYYVDSAEAKPWETITVNSKKRFKGPCYDTPFVVIRRTSSPTDKYRAVGSIIKSHSPVAVENHLIIAKPKDNTLKKCKDLLDRLKDSRTNMWLNNRIRCRHLTVSAIKEIPWWDD